MDKNTPDTGAQRPIADGSAPVSPVDAPPKKKSGKLRGLLAKLALAATAMLLTFLAAEIGFRIAGYGNLEIYEPDRKLFWKLAPNQNCFTKIGHNPVRINSKGTRGPEFAIPKPAGTFRVVCLGDSRTFGWGVAEEDTYSSILESLLQRELGSGRRVEVINAGVNAWSYDQMHVYLRDQALGCSPDLVILADANLWGEFSEEASDEFANQFMQRVRLKNWLRRSALYHYIVEVRLQAYYAKYRGSFVPKARRDDEISFEQQSANQHAQVKKALQKICATLRESKTPGLIVHIPREDESTTPFEAEVRSFKKEVSEQYQIPFLDVSTALEAGQGKKLYLDADPVHLNPEGNRILAEELFNTLRKSPQIARQPLTPPS